MGKRRKYTPKPFESIGGNMLSANLYASMLQSQAWQDLTKNAMILYVYMKLQLYGAKSLPDRPNTDFCFNQAMATKVYKLYSNHTQFELDTHTLIKNGFIEEVENGHTTRTKNIYRFSDKWQTWAKGTDYRPIDMQRRDDNVKEKRKAKNKKG